MAPRFMASIASSVEVCAVIMIIGVCGCSSLTFFRRSSPLPSGILMSQRMTSGLERSAAAWPSA